jgi:hypothetical protein
VESLGLKTRLYEAIGDFARRLLERQACDTDRAHLTLWLNWLGASVTGISLPPATTPNLFDLAVRPWQHVLEPLFGYLILAHRIWDSPELAGAHNFGPMSKEPVTVRELIEMARNAYGSGNVRYRDGNNGMHEAEWLALDTSKLANCRSSNW